MTTWRKRDGTRWTWQWALPRYLVLLAGGIFLFHGTFGLGWLGTSIAILCAFGGAFLLWFSAWRLSRNGPVEVPAGSLRGRFLAWVVRRSSGRAR
jgi:membrane associated rhomboid family serine protease